MNYRTCKPVQDEACRWMLDKPREELAALLPFLLERKAWIAKNGKKDTAGECSKSGSYYFALGNLTGWILKRDLSCSPEQVLAIIKSMLTTSEINISGVLHLANK
jgi:hypothetical protein